jgi:hypothetical protein
MRGASQARCCRRWLGDPNEIPSGRVRAIPPLGMMASHCSLLVDMATAMVTLPKWLAKEKGLI